MSQKENEIFLIKAFKNGNSSAFEKLFKRYHKRLYAFLMQLLNSKEDAEEIVQESFIKIWEKREEFIEGYPFDAYLFKIAKNSFLNHTRKKVNQRIFENYLEYADELSSDNADDYIIYQETLNIIQAIIDKMPPRRREIFHLRKTEGLSRKEIAEKLQISVITVDSQLLKANNFMKEKLKKHNLLNALLILPIINDYFQLF
ncbi:MAG: RNA polymerase sigma-70 factor [Mariniphaga sp.]|nr:RNA polymerase sigma-70 factor [Mariniphaga sp.]